MWEYTCKTAEGLALDIKLMAGETKLVLTKAKAGTGSVNPTQLNSQTNVTEPAAYEPELGSQYRLDATTVEVSVTVNNATVERGFDLWQIGIYAQDPDKGEILYFLAQNEKAREIPSQDKQPGFIIETEFVLGVDNTSQVNVIMNPAGTLTRNEADKQYAGLEHMHEIQDVVNLKTVLGEKANAAAMDNMDQRLSGNISSLSEEMGRALNDKVDKVSGKDLSSNDLTNELKRKYDAANNHTFDKKNPHNVTKAQVGLGNTDNTADTAKPISTAQQAALDEKADLDSGGKVPASQLPSYVDNVLEFEGVENFPYPGETGKIYTDTLTNLTYRWSGTVYSILDPSLALGETSATAYRGDRGKIAYDHSQSAHARLDATNTEKSNINGNIKINDTEVQVYDDTHQIGKRYKEGSFLTIKSPAMRPTLTNLRIDGKSEHIGEPAPDRPVQIVSVENPAVTACGNNLLQWANDGVEFFRYSVGPPGVGSISEKVNQDGTKSIIVTNTVVSTSYSFFYYRLGAVFLKALLPHTNYTVKAKYKSSSNTILSARISTPSSTKLLSDIKECPLNGDNNWHELQATLTTNDLSQIDLNDLQVLGFGGLEGSKTIEFRDFEMTLGLADSEFQPYTGNTATLDGITLRSLPDGTADSIEKRDGIWGVERRAKEIAFVGTEDWESYLVVEGVTYKRYRVAEENLKCYGNDGTANGRCTHFHPTSPHEGYTGSGLNCFTVDAAPNLNFYVNSNSLEEWKSYLSRQYSEGSPVTVQCALAEPIWEPLPDALQTELNKLECYIGTTHIFTDSLLRPVMTAYYSQVAPVELGGTGVATVEAVKEKFGIDRLILGIAALVKSLDPIGTVYTGTRIVSSVPSKVATNVLKLSVPAGVHIVTANVGWSISSTTVTALSIRINGTTSCTVRGTMEAGGGDYASVIVTASADTEITVMSYHAHTSAVSLNSITRLNAVQIK